MRSSSAVRLHCDDARRSLRRPRPTDGWAAGAMSSPAVNTIRMSATPTQVLEMIGSAGESFLDDGVELESDENLNAHDQHARFVESDLELLLDVLLAISRPISQRTNHRHAGPSADRAPPPPTGTSCRPQCLWTRSRLSAHRCCPPGRRGGGDRIVWRVSHRQCLPCIRSKALQGDRIKAGMRVFRASRPAPQATASTRSNALHDRPVVLAAHPADRWSPDRCASRAP